MPAKPCSRASYSSGDVAGAASSATGAAGIAPAAHDTKEACESEGASGRAGTSGGAPHSAAAAALQANGQVAYDKASSEVSGRGQRSSSASASLDDGASIGECSAVDSAAAGSSCGASTAPHEAEAPGSEHCNAPAPGAGAPGAAKRGADAAQQATGMSSAPAAAAEAAPMPAPAEAATLASLSVEHLQRTGALAGDAPECRICLSAERPGALVAACNCIGSMRFAHVDCLETWCEERQSMLCEICGKPYATPLTAQLTAALERGAARHQREQVVQLMEIDGRAVNGRYTTCCGASRARVYVAVLLMFVVTLGLLYVVLFVSGDSQPSVWAIMLLRILAFLLPVYLIVQAVLAYLRFRHGQNARRLQAEGRNAV